MQSDVTKAIRIMREGNSLSVTNLNLKEAVDHVVRDLYGNLSNDYLPQSIGLIIQPHKEGTEGCLKVTFRKKVGGWETFYTPWQGQSMCVIQAFCEELYGELGDRLITWLRETEHIRLGFVVALRAYRDAIITFQASQSQTA
jgi:hypothetical protein